MGLAQTVTHLDENLAFGNKRKKDRKKKLISTLLTL